MTNSACRKTAGKIVILAGIPAIAAVLFHMAGLTAQEKYGDVWEVADVVAVPVVIPVDMREKSIPDHSSFTDCRMCHAETYKMWETTRHSKAIARVSGTPAAAAECFGCHTTEGFEAKLRGGKVDPAKKESFHTISCAACHKPGSGANPRQLVKDPEKLCQECHSQRAVLEGKGARGVEDVRSFHSAVTCVSCHMSEANHDLKLFRPDDPKLPEDRLDTCTRCHKDKNRKMRAKQLPDWQEFYREAMDPIEADMAAISAAIKAKPDLLNAGLKEKLDTINFNLSIIRRDGSRGAHNLDFALEIMAKVSKDIKEIKSTIK